jgi:hypothetical protein
MSKVTDAQLAEVWDRGFTIVPGFVSGERLKAAQEALWAYFPRPEAYFADPAAHPKYSKSQFSGQYFFPFSEAVLNDLCVNPDLVDAAERFCGTKEIDLYKVELWGKYAGAIDYDQPHHRDFGNHTMVAPTLDGRIRHMTTFLLLSDVTEADGPTKVVPLERTRDVPLNPMIKAPGDFVEDEVSITGAAGTLFIYTTHVMHRGSNFTAPGRSRFTLLVDFKNRGARWTGKQAWPDFAIRPHWTEALSAMSVRERDLFGWPPPGDPYWTEQTFRDTQARYPAMDMSAYRPAA